MQGTHTPGATAPHTTPPVTAATAAPPPMPHPANSAVNYVMQTTEAPPQLTSDFWEKGVTATGAVLAILIPLFVKWRMDAQKRRFDVKRKLYLKVADAVHEMSGSVFGSFAGIETTLTELGDRFSKAMAHLSKAEMVADDDLLGSLTKLKNFLGEGFGRFTVIRMQMDECQADINAIEPTLSKELADLQWAAEELRRINVEGLHDKAGQERFQRVKWQFEAVQERHKQTTNDRNAAFVARQAFVVQLAQLAAGFAAQMIPLRVEALFLMRKELDFKFDVDEYRRLQEQMAEKAADMLSDVAKSAEETFKVKP